MTGLSFYRPVEGLLELRNIQKQYLDLRPVKFSFDFQTNNDKRGIALVEFSHNVDEGSVSC